MAVIFLQHGFEASYVFVEKFLFSETLQKIIENKLYQPSKNRLQEYYQEKFKQLPVYAILKETGPQHHKQYTIGVFYKKKLLATGTGKSKKEAEDAAAKIALNR